MVKIIGIPFKENGLFHRQIPDTVRAQDTMCNRENKMAAEQTKTVNNNENYNRD